MADRGRDLKIAVISDTDKFDTSDAAQDLEKLGKEALDAGKDLDNLSKDAADTARKVDSAFEKIAASSKSNLRKVDNDADKAGEGFQGFREEVGDTGREAAASFTGSMDDISGAAQEAAANALRSFGAVGGVLGGVVAAGVGILVSQAQAANERIKELRQGLRDLFREANQGNFKGLEEFESFVQHLEDGGGDLTGFAKALADVGFSVEEATRLAKEGGPEYDKLMRRLHDTGASLGGLGGFFDENTRAAQGAFDALSEFSKGAKLAADDAERFAKTEAIQKSTEELSDAFKNVGDDAVDMGEAVGKGVDAVIAAQKKQLQATVNFEKNQKKVFDKVGQDGVEWALSQGENADEAMQLLANAPKKKAEQIVANYKSLGQKQTQGYAAGIVEKQGSVDAAANKVWTTAKDAMGQQIVIETVVGAPPRSGPGSAAAAEEAARRRIQPIVVPVNYVANPIWRKVP